MDITPYHTKYFAYELTRRFASGSDERLAGTLVNAQVDLNPHQIDAALFAFQSPLSKGALLADEVGLGKTIEAGLLISQRWAERKRKILIITPSNLRKQWYMEMTEKFFVPCEIMESKSYNSNVRHGVLRPFDKDSIIICSYHYACNKAVEISYIPWDLVVIDEAHRLRNVYKPTNRIANTLKNYLGNAPKLLLTATPLQNSILELYGLVSFIDEYVFGDLKSFRERYTRLEEQTTFNELKERLKPICHRTLRRQVEPYIKYTKRFPILQEFTPDENEDELYNMVSEYLRRDNLSALPASQRSLMILVLRKLLASSTFAIAGALDTMAERLRKKLKKQNPTSLAAALGADYENLDEESDEWDDDKETEPLTETEIKAVTQEIKDLEDLKELAVTIDFNAKGFALLTALERAFEQADKIGAPHKAIIFTESRKTQDYLLRVLADSPYNDGLVLFNGSNNDDRSKAIYIKWAKDNAGSEKVTGSRTADMRTALVDYFKEEGKIMIATEAGAEGINLQFCSLVVNYDLPWNPQRIEQRIGRCHRYGQKHDVVVVNFINNKNAADQRVYELLNTKFHLFEGIFGASDEVLGAIESGVDFEKRIVDIYQNCRQPEEINQAFDQLQMELFEVINEKLVVTRQQLLENFDDDVRQKLKLRADVSNDMLNKYEQLLMQLSRYELGNNAQFLDDSTFILKSNPFKTHIELGQYELPRRSGNAHLYRLSHPLAEKLISVAKNRQLSETKLEFVYDKTKGRSFALESYIGKTGMLTLHQLIIETFEQAEEYLLFAAIIEDGEELPAELIPKLFNYSATVIPNLIWNPSTTENPSKNRTQSDLYLTQSIQTQADTIRKEVNQRNAEYFDTEAAKIEGWSEDLKNGLEREIKELDRQMKEVRKNARSALSLEDKLTYQKELRSIESTRNNKRRSLFDAQDEIDKQRETLIKSIENKLHQTQRCMSVFTVDWTLCDNKP